MNALLIIRSTDQFIQEIAPAVPLEVRQLADQLGRQTHQVLDNFAYCGFLITALTAVIVLLFTSLLLVLYHPTVKPVQPEVPLVKFVATNRQLNRPVESYIARANRNELRLVSDRVRAGQLSN